MVKNKGKLFLLFIILLALFLRLNNLHNSIEFAWDQERDAFAVKKILIDKKPILIGPRVVGDKGFMLAPYFFYLLIPFYLVTNFHPYATIVFIAFYNILFLLFSFLTIKEIFSQKIAFIFIFIWSILSLTNYIDTIPWNPVLVPFLFIFLFYLLKKLDFNKLKNWGLLGLYLGFSFNIHVQLIILSFTAFVYLLLKSHKNKILKNTISLFLGFLFSFLPLLIFDLRHNFLNLNLFLNFFGKNNIVKNPFAFIPTWTNFINKLLPINSSFFSISLWFLIAFLLFYFSKKNIFKKLLFFTWTFFPIMFIIYGKIPSEYYFNFCIPIIILTFSFLISKLKINNFFLILLMFSFSFISIFLKLKRNHIYAYSLANKIRVIKYIKNKVDNRKFNISYSVPIGQNSGYLYLMDYFKTNPTNNFKDPLIEIIIPGQEIYKTFGDISVKLPYPFNE
jgi:4-amino-4-deoxy-L-arabinose transferase-like glycosyltransferase